MAFSVAVTDASGRAITGLTPTWLFAPGEGLIGQAALEKHTDPFGQGPFEYQAQAKGFELRSKLSLDGKPVSLVVGMPCLSKASRR